MSGAPIDHAIAERAVQWLMDLQAPTVSQKTRVEFARWRAQSQEHERAWERIEAFQQRFADLQQSHTAPVAHATLAARPNRRQALKALALLVAGGAAWSARDNRLVQDWTADYYTHIGEQRQLTLSDGTRLALNTDSAVDVRFDAGQRRLMLLRGEVMISTGKD
uniref:DUF4880 domain-containing protein n=1 Tax=Pseudomonas sp. TaxID=306 RepID=UPI002586B026